MRSPARSASAITVSRPRKTSSSYLPGATWLGVESRRGDMCRQRGAQPACLACAASLVHCPLLHVSSANTPTRPSPGA